MNSRNDVNTKSRAVKIVPLSQHTLTDAVSLIEAVFPYKPDQRTARRNFTDNVSKKPAKDNYWVAIDAKRNVVGVTGLYHEPYEKNTVWLRWFGVHPRHRRLGLGSLLLQFSIDEARKKGCFHLKLYTSSDENEKVAHTLYRKHGFIQTAANKKEDRIYFVKHLREEKMEQHEIRVTWEGPFGPQEVIQRMKDEDDDAGLYQIYGWHILCPKNALLYIGSTTGTFSRRFKDHKKWLDDDQDEEDIKIYLGRIYDPDIHSEKDNWASWEKDVVLAERILIYKYSPHYNSRELVQEPSLKPYKNIRLINSGKRGRLKPRDDAPKDFRE